MFIRTPRYIARRLMTTLVMVLLFLSGFASAQDPPKSDVPGAMDDFDLNLEVMEEKERLRWVALAMDQMNGASVGVAALRNRGETRERRCVDAKSLQIKGFIVASERANHLLMEAVRRNDKVTQISEAKLIFIAHARVRTLYDDAEACSISGLAPATSDREVIRRTFERHGRQVVECYETLDAPLKTAADRFEVQIHVKASGDVDHLTVITTDAPEPLVSCLTERIHRWIFRDISGATLVHKTWVLGQ